MNDDASTASWACSRSNFLFDELPLERGAEPGSVGKVYEVLGVHGEGKSGLGQGSVNIFFKGQRVDS